MLQGTPLNSSTNAPRLTAAVGDAYRRYSWLGPGMRDEDLVHLMASANNDAEQKAAAKFGVPAFVVSMAAFGRWGTDFTATRDRLVAEQLPEGADRRTVQALRGHVTRRLLKELRPLLELAAQWAGYYDRLASGPATAPPERSGSFPRETCPRCGAHLRRGCDVCDWIPENRTAERHCVYCFMPISHSELPPSDDPLAVAAHAECSAARRARAAPKVIAVELPADLPSESPDSA